MKHDFDRPRSVARYTQCMVFAIFGMRVLEVLFFVGIIGSAVVVTITSFEDAHELLGKTETAPSEEKTTP